MRKLLLLSLFALAGCQSTEMASTPRSIIFDGVSRETIADTTVKAQAHCEKFGRDAEFVPDDNPDGRSQFKCVDRPA